jgi:methylated-DNA-[protein]-cysteine S-methyltransferase
MASMVYTQIESPVGPLLLVADEAGLRQILFVNGRHSARPDPAWKQDAAPLHTTISQLRSYFASEREDFDLPLAPEGTPFQLEVWRRLIGNPQASRAVGLANGSNPIPIVIPCHRVIGSNGKLTGYGGGLPIKEKLLALEKKQLRLL